MNLISKILLENENIFQPRKVKEREKELDKDREIKFLEALKNSRIETYNLQKYYINTNRKVLFIINDNYKTCIIKHIIDILDETDLDGFKIFMKKMIEKHLHKIGYKIEF